jgi:hypothetical protein
LYAAIDGADGAIGLVVEPRQASTGTPAAAPATPTASDNDQALAELQAMMKKIA